MREDRTLFDWISAAVHAALDATAGYVVGTAMALMPLAMLVGGLVAFALWCVARASKWTEQPLSRAGTMAGVICTVLPMIHALENEKYGEFPLPLTFSQRELPLQEALRELRGAGFQIEVDAWHLPRAVVHLSSRRPSFDELDRSLRDAGVRVHVDYDYAQWSMLLGPRAKGTWTIRVHEGARFGPIRWVRHDLQRTRTAQETA